MSNIGAMAVSLVGQMFQNANLLVGYMQSEMQPPRMTSSITELGGGLTDIT